LPESGKFSGITVVAGNGSAIAAQTYSGTGHWLDDYRVDSRAELVRIDGSSLPKIDC